MASFSEIAKNFGASYAEGKARALLDTSTSKVKGPLGQVLNAGGRQLLDSASSQLFKSQFKAGSVLGDSGKTFDPLRGVHSRGDAIQNFNWYVQLPILEGSFGSRELSWKYVEASNLPFRKIDTNNSYRAAHQEAYPKGYSVDNLTLTFFLDDTGAALNYLQAWYKLIHPRLDGSVLSENTKAQGLWGRPGRYKKKVTVHVLSVNRSEVLTVNYHLAWPTNLDFGDLASGASERLTLSVNFEVEDMDFIVQAASASALPGIISSNPQDFLSKTARTLGVNVDLSSVSSSVSKAGSSIANFFS